MTKKNTELAKRNDGNIKNTSITRCLGKNYYPTSQSFMAGFLGPKDDLGYSMIFDLNAAKEIAEKEGLDNIEYITAGLDGDFNCTAGTIYDDEIGWHCGGIGYDHSIWATPIIVIQFKNGTRKVFECWYKE